MIWGLARDCGRQVTAVIVEEKNAGVSVVVGRVALTPKFRVRDKRRRSDGASSISTRPQRKHCCRSRTFRRSHFASVFESAKKRETRALSMKLQYMRVPWLNREHLGRVTLERGVEGGRRRDSAFGFAERRTTRRLVTLEELD